MDGEIISNVCQMLVVSAVWALNLVKWLQSMQIESFMFVMSDFSAHSVFAPLCLRSIDGTLH